MIKWVVWATKNKTPFLPIKIEFDNLPEAEAKLNEIRLRPSFIGGTIIEVRMV